MILSKNRRNNIFTVLAIVQKRIAKTFALDALKFSVRTDRQQFKKVEKLFLEWLAQILFVSFIGYQQFSVLSEKYCCRFSRLFACLEENGDEYGISSFGVSLNTLEQVFLT